ncbi:MAG TPA: ADP-ribosylglycohydrolase family protein [Candidatus Eisenbacteria bacterium]|jgi:ADP-ribosylglycohydrolase|nr:ADP-ribosylglycohydrolase family protein [Candidatus Eisenbacteria bacterium]
MLGAIAGDMIGRPYEFALAKIYDFPLFGPESKFTDDTVLTIALADSLLSGRPYVDLAREYFHLYPDCAYGMNFGFWAMSGSREPYGSYGNGSAMRVSPAAWRHDTLEEVLAEAERSALITHDHPEGIRGAQATAAALFLARTGASKDAIRAVITQRFGYEVSTPIERLQPIYEYSVTCQGTVPAALIAFLDSSDFESAVRNAVSLGGDADTLACITGSVAEAYYGGVPRNIEERVWALLDERLRSVTTEFRARYVEPRLVARGKS